MPKIKLPNCLPLGTNGQLGRDSIGHYDNKSWPAEKILSSVITAREKDTNQPVARLLLDQVQMTQLGVDYLLGVSTTSSEPICYGRTELYGDVAIKFQKIADGVVEDPECLLHELKMQVALPALGLRSDRLLPIGMGVDGAGRHYSAFTVPKGYYEYLTDITDEDRFTFAASRCAYDLGLCLKNGYVFQNLISVFHAQNRPYTLLPGLTGLHAVNFGGFPGKIERVIGLDLYENLGFSGLRDVGDMEFIEDFKFRQSDGQSVENTVSMKIAHFISLYLMVFTIILGNRSRKLDESSVSDEPVHWTKNAKLYSIILRGLFEGLGVEMTPEDMHYLDLSQDRTKVHSVARASMMQPSQKFNEQLRAWFTQKESINDQEFSQCNGKSDNGLRLSQQKALQDKLYGGSEKIIFGPYLRCEERQYLRGAYRNRTNIWQYFPGCLGEYSGVNPLTTAVKYALRAAQVAVGSPGCVQEEWLPEEKVVVEVENAVHAHVPTLSVFMRIIAFFSSIIKNIIDFFSALQEPSCNLGLGH